MKYTINGKDSTLKSTLLFWNARMPNWCVNDITKRLTEPLKKQDYNGPFEATEYAIYFKDSKDMISVKF